MLKRKKVCLLFCGGTGLSQSAKPPFSVSNKQEMSGWLENFEELKVMVAIDPVFIYGGEAENVSVKEWMLLGNAIKERLGRYDGFVITHGPATMHYTASALAFMLQRLPHPVVLTGSSMTRRGNPKSQALERKTAEFQSLGMKANLLNAFQAATSTVKEVCIVIGSRILRGVEAMPSLTPSLNYFSSLSGSYLGRADFGLTLAGKQPRPDKKAFKFLPGFDNQVLMLELHPQLDLGLLKRTLLKHTHGLILRTTVAGELSPQIQGELKAIIRSGVPVVLYADRDIDKIKDSGDFILVNAMTPVAALVKLMWVLGQTRERKKLRTLMQSNLVGEIINRQQT